jgi:gluconokinase
VSAEAAHGPLLVAMGPSGAGKSRIGALLAARLGVPFVDGDALHSERNVARMHAGIPLTDDDRMPWLDAVAAVLAEAPGGMVVACSALRRAYRDRILAGAPGTRFVELRASRAELDRRMTSREHFMPPALLDSQLETWEPLQPGEPGVSVLNEGAPDAVATAALAALRLPA